MVEVKTITLGILISVMISGKLSAKTDSLRKTEFPRIVLQTDITGLAGFILWPNALIYRAELDGSYWFNNDLETGLALGRGGRSANVVRTNLYDYHTRGYYARAGLRLRNFKTYKRLNIVGSIDYFFTAFETSGTFKIKHKFWDDYEEPIKLENQIYHGLMFTFGLQYWLTESWNIGIDVGVTTPFGYKNFDYPDPFSEIHHDYIPGAGILLLNNRALKTSFRLGYKLDKFFSN